MLQKEIEAKLALALSPEYLSVVNESHMHNVPPGSESHFKVVVVSDVFSNERLIARHRRINQLLEQELATQIHALAIHTYTPEEWRERSDAPASPHCRGGGHS
jgi:BolA protein